MDSVRISILVNTACNGVSDREIEEMEEMSELVVEETAVTVGK